MLLVHVIMQAGTGIAELIALEMSKQVKENWPLFFCGEVISGITFVTQIFIIMFAHADRHSSGRDAKKDLARGL